MAHQGSAAQVQADIRGLVSGQVAVGNYNIQSGSIHGGRVTISPPSQPPCQPEALPIDLRPRPFPGFLDREPDLQNCLTALKSRLVLQVYGEKGAGKTSLLRAIARATPPFPNGIYYGAHLQDPPSDILQRIFEAFYECPNYLPTPTQRRKALHDRQVLVFLDDASLTQSELTALLNETPSLTFAIASSIRSLVGEGLALELSGLPEEAALLLVERGGAPPLALRNARQPHTCGAPCRGFPCVCCNWSPP